ncbi:MAG: serine/threonine-protein kinase [Aquabacterium sp.]
MPTISEHDALPTGTRLAEFEIQQVLGIGGFGVVYLAFDHALERQVAIKEYMPAALAGRGPGSEVVVRSSAHADTFTLGLRSFINEARLLARFDHASLVEVYRFWEAHGTAYMVMPFYRGRTLQQVRREMSGPPDEVWLRRLITPLLGALECLHKENVFHRDVAPDNILLLDDESGPGMGPPVLLDLGAARRVIGDHTQTLTAIVKPSFAPIEQYAETVQLRQGPWTDLYALAAVMHFCITGRPPVPATVRAVQDEHATLRQMSASLASGFDCHFSESFIHAIDHALSIRPQDRPDSVAAWRAELSGIVSERTGAGIDAPIDAKSAKWLAHTVLVRNEDGHTSPGHQAVEAQSYMTTIPAGRLNAPVAWPDKAVAPVESRAAPPLAMPVAVPDTVPQTIPVSPPAAAAPASAEPVSDEPLHPEAAWPDTVQARPAFQAHVPPLAGTAPAAMQSRIWLRWVFAALTLALITALWWTQHRARTKGYVPALDAVAATQNEPTQAAGLRMAAALPPADEAKPEIKKVSAAASAASKPKRRPKPEAQAIGKEAPLQTAEAAEQPLNPRKACGNKVFIWLAICMKRHCGRPEYAGHAECERMRQQEAAQHMNNYP